MRLFSINSFRYFATLAVIALASVASAYTLPLPDVPRSLTTPQERAAFVADHYWDGMDWRDTLLLRSDQFMGESMATYGTLLGIAPRDRAEASVRALIDSVGENSDALNTLADYSYSYFYYPESPMYDEELYFLFIDPLLSRKALSEENAERLRDRKEGMLKNRVGTIATDFEYVGTDGDTHTLFTTPKGTETTLLMFYSPECDVCEEAIKILNSSDAFAELQKEGKAQVIAINAYGQEKAGPAERKPGMPDNWIVGYSPEGRIDAEELYLIRATPAIYILDPDFRILQKDLPLPRLSSYLNSLQ